LGWDLPLVESLMHNTRNGEFKARVYASELRRAKLAPLFRDWIPKDCTAICLGGVHLAELCIPDVIMIRYTTADFQVWRKVSYLNKGCGMESDLTFPQDWLAEFKDDVVAHYTIEKTVELAKIVPLVMSVASPD